MTSLLSLPEHLVGIIYALVPCAASRRAFYSSTKGVRDASSVLAQICHATIHTADLERLGQDVWQHHPVLSFPRGACLRHLTIRGCQLETAPVLKTDGAWILEVLVPWERLQHVERLELLQIQPLEDPWEAARVAAVLHSLPQLRVLKMDNGIGLHRSICHAAFFQVLSEQPVPGLPTAPRPNPREAAAPGQLKELECSFVTPDAVQHIGCLRGLERLSFSLMYGGRTPTTLHPLSSLASLKHLSICPFQHNGLLGLEDVAPHLQCLRSVALPDFRSLSQLSSLRFVNTIQLHHVMGTALTDYLGVLAELVASGPLDSNLHVRELHVRELDLYWGAEVLINAGEVGAGVARHVAALPDLELHVEQVEAPSFWPLFQYFMHQPLGRVASSIQFVRIDLSSVPPNVAQELSILRGDLSRLALLCPNLQGLVFVEFQFQDLSASLTEIANDLSSLRFLGLEQTDLGTALNSLAFSGLQQDTGAALLVFFEQCAVNPRRCSDLEVVVCVPEGAHYIRGVLERVKHTWAEVSEALPHKHCNVSLSLTLSPD